jgi:2-hydroxy-4-(methylsulfanyl)butanoate S-methyltransferase
MANSIARPDTINKLRFAADAALAMLAGMQLDVFTPMREGPMTPEQIANAIGVKADRLRLLLWALVAAGLLTEKDGRFSNTQETNQFLVKGAPAYMGRQTRKPFQLMELEAQNCGFNSNWCAAG